MSYRIIRIQGTLNLLRCAEKNTATKKLSTSYVTCHQRQQPHSQTLLLPIPPLCTVGWFNKTEFVVFWNQPIYFKKNIYFSKPPKVSKQKKEFLSLAISLTRSLQPMQFQGPQEGTKETDSQTDIATCRLNQPSGHCNIKKKKS